LPAVTPQRTPYKEPSTPHTVKLSPTQRVRLLYIVAVCILAIFAIRLFYLQVIRHDYYRKTALQSQLKEYEVPAARGVIKAYDGENTTPLVLNEKKFTLFADPKFIKDAPKEAAAVGAVIGGDVNELIKKLETKDTRYVVLAKKLSKEQAEKIDGLKLTGIGTREASYRYYPQGGLAAQVLGFVNDDGEGQYGLEQAENDRLKGTPGLLKAITDAAGVPLVANKDNVMTDPKAGDELQLTIDINLQKQVEELLKAGLDKAKSKSGSALIMETKTGAIKAMANYPSYDPSNIAAVEDISALSNASVSAPLEVGSIMKVLTVAAAIDKGVATKDTTFNDTHTVTIDDATISNVEEDGGRGTKSVGEILRLSLNTGAVFMLKQMGGGEVNEKARTTWYDYLTNHYGFGQKTGIEQANEASGVIPDPKDGFGLNVQYATMAFGQGMTQTMLQMAAAVSGAVNGGTYYKPHLIASSINGGKTTVNTPQAVRQELSASTSKDITELMEYVYGRNHANYGMPTLPAGYRMGGKTGSAQIAGSDGTYLKDKFTGTFVGFIGGNTPGYVIVTRVNEPGIGGYAGSKTAAPIFSSIAQMMIDNFGLTPRN